VIAMTVLEALATLEAATRECKQRNINTPEVREALDSLDRYVWPKWLVPQFRLVASDGYGQSDVDREDQQQMLRATFPGVRDAVRELLSVRMDALARRFHETHDAAVKDEIYRLARDMGRSRSRGFLTRKASTWSLSDTIVISPGSARRVASATAPRLAGVAGVLHYFRNRV
jgi:hypothetical protein